MISLGKGVLTWDVHERRSDRYGSVYLIPEGTNSLTPEEPRSLIIEPVEIAGQRGALVAIVTATRDSTHVGDLFRGVYPRKPEIGQRIKLGDGILFFGQAPFAGHCVGLRPADGRCVDWLDIRALYDAHEQSVELFFEEEVPCG